MLFNLCTTDRFPVTVTFVVVAQVVRMFFSGFDLRSVRGQRLFAVTLQNVATQREDPMNVLIG